MALVYHNNRPYSYRSIRRGGRVTSEYRGSGDSALRAEERASDERAEREANRRDWEALEETERPLIDYFNQVEDLARSHLLANGFHQHKSQWRRRRVGKQEG